MNVSATLHDIVSVRVRAGLQFQTACDGETLNINCAPGRQIRINSARYGGQVPSCSDRAGGSDDQHRSSTGEPSHCESTRELQALKR